MEAKVQTITPEIARQMLIHNGANRKLRQPRVEKYANDMRNGNWHLTGQAITFAKDGKLLDGQHRLSAVILADTPVDFLVVTDADSVATYDCGLSRSIADQLYLSGCNYVSAIMSTNGIAVIRAIYSITHFGACQSEKLRTVTTDDINTFIIDNMDDIEWICNLVANGRGLNQKGLNKTAVFATLYGIYLLDERVTRVRVERIIDVYRKGVMANDYEAPIIGLRNKMLSTKYSNSTADAREVSYRVMYAVSQYMRGSTVSMNRVPIEPPYDFSTLIK